MANPYKVLNDLITYDIDSTGIRFFSPSVTNATSIDPSKLIVLDLNNSTDPNALLVNFGNKNNQSSMQIIANTGAIAADGSSAVKLKVALRGGLNQSQWYTFFDSSKAVSKDDILNFVTKTELATTLGDYAKKVDLLNYVKTTELANYAKISYVDNKLTLYATKADLAGYVSNETLLNYTPLASFNTLKTGLSNEGINLEWNAHLPSVEVAYSLPKHSLAFWKPGAVGTADKYWLYTDGTVWNGVGTLGNVPTAPFKQIKMEKNVETVRTFSSIATEGQTVIILPYEFNSCILFINGVRQNQSNGAFNIVGNTLELSSPLVLGDDIFVYMAMNEEIVITDQTVKMFSYVTEADSTTSITIPYDFGSSSVFLNGVLQNSITGAYTVLNRVITFSEPLPKGTNILAYLGNLNLAPYDFVTTPELEAGYVSKKVLSSPLGYGLIGKIKSVAEMRTLDPQDNGVTVILKAYADGLSYGGGEFVYDANDTQSQDDGGSVIVTANGKRFKRVMAGESYFFSDFGADPSGSTDATEAVQRAVNSVGAARNKSIALRAGDRYSIRNLITVPQSVVINGSRRGMTQGWASRTENGPNRASNPDGSAFVWEGPQNIGMFDVGYNVVFNGVIFAYIGQNVFATKESELRTYGTTIKAKGSLNVISCLYYGMTDFVRTTGEASIFLENYGFCTGTAYYIEQSADVNRFENCHHNPNVVRPPLPFVHLVGGRDSYFANLYQHDETVFLNCHSIATRTFVKTAGPTRLVGVNMVNCVIDRTGTLIDIDAASSSQVSITSTLFICDYAKNTIQPDGSRTVDADAGGIVLRRSAASASVFQLKITGSNFTFANHPFGLLAPQMFNFQSIDGFSVQMTGLNIANLTNTDTGEECLLSNDVAYNQFLGEVVLGIRRYTYEQKPINYLPNPAFAIKNISGSQPTGWRTVGCSMGADNSAITSSSGTAAGMEAYIEQNVYKGFSGQRTYMVSAYSIGNSAGVRFVLAKNDGSGVVTVVQPWKRVGARFYAIYRNNDTTLVSHTFQILAGGNGNRVNIEYAALCSGDILTYTNNMSEVGVPNITTGVNRWSALVQAGIGYQIPPTVAPLRGAATVYIQGPFGSGIYNIVKNDESGSAGTFVKVSEQLVGANTYTITWPAGKPPVIYSSTAQTITITYTGI